MARGHHADQERYETLRRSLADVGLFRRGSVVRRLVPCGKSNCACQSDPPRLHGPYYQWTRKVRGKTVTVRLTEGEATLLSEWISNARQLDRALAAMERLALRITERLLRRTRQS